MIVIAHRQLRGEYGTLAPGDQCEIRDDLANDLIKRRLVSTVTPEAKVVNPPETTPVVTPATPAPRSRSTKNKD